MCTKRITVLSKFLSFVPRHESGAKASLDRHDWMESVASSRSAVPTANR